MDFPAQIFHSFYLQFSFIRLLRAIHAAISRLVPIITMHFRHIYCFVSKLNKGRFDMNRQITVLN